MRWVLALVVVWGSVAFADDASLRAENQRLRDENATLKRRVAELESQLGAKAGSSAPARANARTFHSFEEAQAAAKVPPPPWTGLQEKRIQEGVRAALVGQRFEMTLTLNSATPADGGGVTCIFEKLGPKANHTLTAKFPPRYADTIATWDIGRQVAIAGTIEEAGVQVYKGVTVLGLSLTDCAPANPPGSR